MRPGVRLLGQLCEPILKPVRRIIPPIGADRFFGALGVDRHRRAADTSAMNMTSYMLEITAKDCLRGRHAGRRDTRKPGKYRLAHAVRGRSFFRNCAKHRLFSMLFSAPS